MKLMNIQAKLKLHNLRNKIALLQLRETWKPEEKKIKCPFCQSQAVYRQWQQKTGNTHGCQSCQRKFSEELLPGCVCRTPGRLQKCLDCPQFQSILPLIKEKVSNLQNFTLQELEDLVEELEHNEKDTQGRTPSTGDDFYHSLVGLSALSPNHHCDSLFSQFAHQGVYVSNIEKCREAMGVGFPVSQSLDVNQEMDSSDSF
jgi:transposase-like protein